MDKKKANLTCDISAGILKSCVDSYIPILIKILNTSLERGCFPDQHKLVEVTPVFKLLIKAKRLVFMDLLKYLIHLITIYYLPKKMRMAFLSLR